MTDGRVDNQSPIRYFDPSFNLSRTRPPLRTASLQRFRMRSRFSGRKALVTGAARGIGRAIADALANEGAQLALFDLPGSCVTTAESELRARGISAVAIEGDVASAADVERAVDTAARELGGIDLLINNAGVAPMRAFLQTDVEFYDRIMAVNA